jgi:hypothetical protein
MQGVMHPTARGVVLTRAPGVRIPCLQSRREGATCRVQARPCMVHGTEWGRGAAPLPGLRLVLGFRTAPIRAAPLHVHGGKVKG